MVHLTTAKPPPAEHATGKPLAVPVVPRAVLPLATVGHLVPQRDFTARVHSVFARACNLQLDAALMTLNVAAGGDGPLQVRLAEGPAWDLRRLFAIGDAVSCRGGMLQSQRAWLDLRAGAVWRPGAPPPLMAAEVIADNAGHAAALLWQHRSARERERGAARSRLFGKLETGPEGSTRELIDAARALDAAAALPALRRLVGWGEGLTPAGDDFIAGWLAGLQRLAGFSQARAAFVAAVAAAARTLAERTTAIAAQMLHLAARGEHGSLLLAGRDALLAEPRAAARDTAWQALLGLGASSGADMACGLLAAVDAWGADPAGASGMGA